MQEKKQRLDWLRDLIVTMEGRDFAEEDDFRHAVIAQIKVNGIRKKLGFNVREAPQTDIWLPLSQEEASSVVPPTGDFKLDFTVTIHGKNLEVRIAREGSGRLFLTAPSRWDSILTDAYPLDEVFKPGMTVEELAKEAADLVGRAKSAQDANKHKILAAKHHRRRQLTQKRFLDFLSVLGVSQEDLPKALTADLSAWAFGGKDGFERLGYPVPELSEDAWTNDGRSFDGGTPNISAVDNRILNEFPELKRDWFIAGLTLNRVRMTDSVLKFAQEEGREIPADVMETIKAIRKMEKDAKKTITRIKKEFKTRKTLLIQVEGEREREAAEKYRYFHWFKSMVPRGYIKKPEANPGVVNGIRKSVPMTHDEADGNRCNPMYAYDRGYRINCQSCVVTYELRRRGFNLETNPNRKGSMLNALAADYNRVWLDPATNEPVKPLANYNANTDADFLAWMDEIVEPGARYTLRVAWKNSHSGHVVNVIEKNGKAVIYDPQSGEHYEGQDRMKFMANAKSKGDRRPELLRIDNAALDMGIVEMICRRGS